MQNKSILIVDHDPKNVTILENNFREFFSGVDHATSDQEAYAKMKQHCYHVVLSEVFAPNIDGYQLLEQMQRDSTLAHIPVIFLTTKSDIWNRVKSVKLGAKDYIIKPKHVKEIVARVRMVLNRLERKSQEEIIERKKFTGRLEDFNAADLITLFGTEKNTGILTLYNENSQSGQIFFKDGNIYNATVGAFKSEEAVYKMLSWLKGRFSMLFCEIDIADEMNVSNLGIILQGAKRMEQRDLLLKELPSLDAVVVTTSNFKKIIDQKDLSPDLKTFLGKFDGERTLGYIVDTSLDDELLTLNRILKLYRLGFLHVLRDFSKKSAIPAPVDNEPAEPVSSGALEKEEQNITFSTFDQKIPPPFYKVDDDIETDIQDDMTSSIMNQAEPATKDLAEQDSFYNFQDKMVDDSDVVNALPSSQHAEEIELPPLPFYEKHPADALLEINEPLETISAETEGLMAHPSAAADEESGQEEADTQSAALAQQQQKVRDLFKQTKGAVLVLGSKRKDFVDCLATNGTSEYRFNEKMSEIYYGTAKFKGDHFLNLVSISCEREFAAIIDYFKPSLLGYIFIIQPDEKKYDYFRYLVKIFSEKLNIPSLIVVLTDEEGGSIDHVRSMLSLKPNARVKFCTGLSTQNAKALLFSLFENFMTRKKPAYQKKIERPATI